MFSNDNEPSVVAPCRQCGTDTVWLRTRNGGWRLFETSMQPTDGAFAGNRFAVDRRTRLVVDLDCVRESRWPRECLALHRFRCPQSYDESRHHGRRPRQPNEIDLSDLLQRLATASQSDEHVIKHA